MFDGTPRLHAPSLLGVASVLLKPRSLDMCVFIIIESLCARGLQQDWSSSQ